MIQLIYLFPYFFGNIILHTSCIFPGFCDQYFNGVQILGICDQEF